jgi:hypothetical protein
MSNIQPDPPAIRTVRRRRLRYVTLSAVLLATLVALPASGQSGVIGEFSSTTQDRVNTHDWWPTKFTPPFNAYAGANACAECHAKQTSSQLHTPMAEAAFLLRENTHSQKVPSETLRIGAYVYKTSSDRLGSSLAVSSGKQTVTAEIAWIFGAGVRGQTYILARHGVFYESQVSTFPGLPGLALTPGHAPVEPGDLKNSLGARLSVSGMARCFACHTTYSSTDGKFDLSHAVPGIHCEGCHGPGLAHIVAEQAEELDEGTKSISNPAHLSPVESVDFCGACHRTSVDVVESGEFSPINVRFQPYRLEKSRCWGAQGNDRLTCVACHNPHEPLVRSASFYDERCLQCHAPRGSDSTSSRSPHAACPKATANCTSCHMPKYDVPSMHAKFTDHFIRVVRAGESYPN